MREESGCKKEEIHPGLGSKLRRKRRCQGDSGKLERLEENQRECITKTKVGEDVKEQSE